ncbi:BQ2448_1398 [Microbotryum intermedium]|uniref:Ribosomal RNA-processing protein 40 n=1 Tax=Microbotryum intermedium TaxID=269621 RepID=A0A238FDP4_9BASI|nr:BQ2448_1398 [Microbotryum intermedium]
MARVLLPGDRLPSTLTSAASAATTLHLGPGLQSVVVPSSYKRKNKAISDAMDTDEKLGKEHDEDEEDEDVVAYRAGLLGMQEDKKSQKCWIEGTSWRVSATSSTRTKAQYHGIIIVGAECSELTKRFISATPISGTFVMQYIPQPPEPVIGIIVARHAEGYRVDIGSSQAASLDALAFEGATKRNKPNLKVRIRVWEAPSSDVGTLVYAHLLATPPFSEPEISCVDAATQKAAGSGELAGGFLIRHVELGRCRALLSPKHPILERLGAQFPFEIAVGMNGRVWVKAGDDDTEKLIAMIAELRGDQ